MKKLIYSIFTIGTLASLGSCSTDYLDVNKNPNEAYVDQLTPKERLAAAETTLHATHSVTLNRFGNLMMNAWAGNIFQFTAPFNDEVNMNVSSTFYNNIWDNYYYGIGNLQTIIETQGATTNFPKYVGAAKVLKAYYMQTIVDLYNDVPYSDAFKGQANVSPKYDKGADVYKALIQEVDDAILLLNNATGTIDAGSDPMFGGDVNRWKQMANTVKLKLVVRLSKATDPAVVAYRDAALATLPTTASSYLATDATIQPGFNAGNTAQQNPLYRNYGVYTLSNEINQNYRLVLASEHIIDDLNGVSVRTGGVYDKRIEKMFFPNVWNYFEDADMTPGYEDDFFGMPQGSTSQAGQSVGDYAGLGTKQFTIGNTTGSSQAGIVMSAAETQFLLAEAAVAFPAKFSNAQTYFNNGVIASFAFYGYSSANANSYLSQVNALPNVGWTGSADKVAAIQYQRWIALTNINPTETFIGYTKTGYPATPLPIGSATSRPTRLIYPQSEYIANSGHVPSMIKSDAFSKTNQFAPFWLK